MGGEFRRPHLYPKRKQHPHSVISNADVVLFCENSLQGVLSDSDGEMIISSPAGETANGFRLEWDLLAGEDYYITVSAEETTELPAYQLYVEHAGFDIYSYDVELLGYKNRITNFCKELFNDGNQHMSQTVYNEYELAFDADLAVHELPENIENISDGLAYEAAVREYFFTKQEELEEVKQGYLDIIEEYIEAEPINMTANAEPLSDDVAIMNIDETEEENEASTVIRRPSGGAGAPLSTVQSATLTMTDGIIENETVAEMTATTSSGARPLLKVVSKTENSITIQAKFPTPGAAGNEIWVVDFNNGVTKEKLVFNGSQTTDTHKTITSSMLDDGIVPGGMYVIGMYWSTDGGVTNGGENARFVWVQLPPDTDADMSLTSSSNQKVQVRMEAADKIESTVNSIDYFTSWIDNMGSVYETLQDFTGYTPSYGSALEFRSTRASMNGNNLQSRDEIDNEENYWFLVAGYASNPAMISRPFFRSFMMRLKDGDWGDAVIHEMSHAFDHDNWSFDMEVWADLKLCYVLEQHPGSKIYRFDTMKYYDKETIYNFFKSEQFDSYDNTFAKGEYHHRGMTAVMLDIVDETGWDAFRTVLHDMNDLNEDEYKYIYEENLPEPTAKFNLFITKLKEATKTADNSDGKNIIDLILNQPVAEGETKTVAEVITDCYGGYIEYYNTLRTSPTLVNKETVNKPSAGYVIRRFIPDENCKYYFFTTRYGGTGVESGTVIEIYEDDYLTILKEKSSSSSATRFSMVGVELNANQTYYVKVRATDEKCILHADIDVHKGEIEQLTGAAEVDRLPGQAGIFEFKPTRGGDYVISTMVHNDGAPGITDAIIEIFENDLSNRIERSTYEQAKFPGITVTGLTTDKTYYIVLKGYVDRQVKAEISIIKTGITAEITPYYDNAFVATYPDAVERIAGLHQKAAKIYKDLCGLTITTNPATLYASPPDLCDNVQVKGDVCTSLEEEHSACSTPETILSIFGPEKRGTKTKSSVLWIDNYVASSGGYNRSYSSWWYNVLFIAEYNMEGTGDDKENDVLSLLVHELAHQYGGEIDHYHTYTGPCENPDVCDECNAESKRKSFCIMDECRPENIENQAARGLFCTPCKNEIFTHLNDHH